MNDLVGKTFWRWGIKFIVSNLSVYAQHTRDSGFVYFCVSLKTGDGSWMREEAIEECLITVEEASDEV